LEAAVHYAKHVSDQQVEPPEVGPNTYTLPTGEIIKLLVAPGSVSGYRGVYKASSRKFVKPFSARLGKSYIGCFPTATLAALAVALAYQARQNHTPDGLKVAAMLVKSLSAPRFSKLAFDTLMLKIGTGPVQAISVVSEPPVAHP
jgi:hypothetical protein